MGVFVDFLSTPFANLANTPTTILVANANTLEVNGITIKNLVAESIRINLQKIRTQTLPVTILSVSELLIAPFQTVDILNLLGIQIRLDYNITPSISDSLVCYSNGYSQKFNCDITYMTLNDLPFSE